MAVTLIDTNVLLRLSQLVAVMLVYAVTGILVCEVPASPRARRVTRP
jgi:hypothetical protein